MAGRLLHPTILLVIFAIFAPVLIAFTPGFAVAQQPVGLAHETFDCLIEPRVSAKVSAAASGIIAQVLVERGDLVKEGQVVARLETAVEQAALELAKARADNDLQIQSSRIRADFSRKKAGRLEKLRPNNTVSEATYDEAVAESMVAEANLREAEANQKIAIADMKRAQAQLDQRFVRSPISGVVVERSLSAGEYRNEQSHIVTIAQIDVLNVEVFVPIAYYGQMHVNSRAEVMPESPVGGQYAATVIVVDRVLDAASGTFGVRLALPNAGYQLPGGLRCKVRFLTDEAGLKSPSRKTE